MSTFWLFAFERFIGDEPTNNRSIEIQLMTRFLKDNFHLELLLSVPSAFESSEVTHAFTKAIFDHVCNLSSTKHLDTTFHSNNSITDGENIKPATKYTICSFPEKEYCLKYTM